MLEMHPDKGGCDMTNRGGGGSSGGGGGGDPGPHAAGVFVKATLTYTARQEHAPLNRIRLH